MKKAHTLPEYCPFTLQCPSHYFKQRQWGQGQSDPMPPAPSLTQLSTYCCIYKEAIHAQLMLFRQQSEPPKDTNRGGTGRDRLGTSQLCLLLHWVLNMRSNTQQSPPRRGTHKALTPMPSPHLVSDPWPQGRAGHKHLQWSYCFSLLLSTPDGAPQSIFQWPKWQMCAVWGKDGLGKVSWGTLPRPCTSAYGLENRSVSRHSLRYHSSWYYTSWGCSWSLTPFGGMWAQSLSPQSGCLSTALDWGFWRAHHTSPTEQRGWPSPLPIHGHFSTVLHATGVKENHAEGSMPAQHRHGLWSLCYSKLWMSLFPVRYKGMLIDWCSSACFSFFQHIMEVHLKSNRF